MTSRVVVLISGGGSNLQTLIDAAKLPACSYEIVYVVSNRPGAGGLTRAQAASIGTAAIDHKAYPDRLSFEADLSACIDAARPDFVICAGFMRVLTSDFVVRYHGRMINIHPSLLPNFRGLQTHRRAIEAGVAFAGCTVHWVSVGVDEGAIIGQAIVTVRPGDTPEKLAARVLIQEHRLLPTCVEIVASRRATLCDGQACIDGRPGAIAILEDGTIVD